MGEVAKGENCIAWCEMPQAFRIGADYLLQRIERKGGWYANEDIRVYAC